MAKKQTTKRSLDLLRKQGWTVEVVERWNPFARVLNDLFGFIDIVAMSEGGGFLAVQTTTKPMMKARLEKIAAEPRAKTWIRAGGRIVVHGWWKGGPRSPNPGRWMVEVQSYPIGTQPAVAAFVWEPVLIKRVPPSRAECGR
jgi:hypothetical protein